MKRSAATTLVIALAAGPVLAQSTTGVQESGDWDLRRVPAEKLVMAYTVFSSGLGIGVRCTDGRTLETLIAGLPSATGETRPLRVSFGEGEFDEGDWNVGSHPSVAIGNFPAPFARKLRLGGPIQIVAPGGAQGGRDLRLVATLPVSTAAIDEVLTTCRRPLVDPRDATLAAVERTGLPAPLKWVEAPRPEFPVRQRTYERGFAVLTCLTTPRGPVSDCVVESEFPADGGFGEAALNGVRNARIGVDGLEPGAYPVRQISFRTVFSMAPESDSRRFGRGDRRRPRS